MNRSALSRRRRFSLARRRRSFEDRNPQIVEVPTSPAVTRVCTCLGFSSRSRHRSRPAVARSELRFSALSRLTPSRINGMNEPPSWSVPDGCFTQDLGNAPCGNESGI